MKMKFLFSILSLFMALSLFAQEERPISDHITYDQDCDLSNVIVSSDDFSFSVTFDPTPFNAEQGKDFNRDVEAHYSVGNSGQIYLLRDFGADDMEDIRTVTLNNADFDALPEGEIKISFIIKYTLIDNNPYTNVLTVFDNGAQVGSKSFNNVSDPALTVGLIHVSCFTKVECDDVTITLYTKNGWVRSSVNPKGGNYSYSWAVDGDANEIPPNWQGYGGTAVRILPGCNRYTLTITDLDTGCEYSRSRVVCTPETPKDDFPTHGFNDSGDIETRSGDIQEEASMSVYPNPTIGDLNIELTNLKSNDVELYIMDIQGRVISQTTLATEQGQVNYNWAPDSSLVAGVYFVQVIDQGQVINKRFSYTK